jgi:leader peptidase (prepilin peptidase)/N-methyltransferase
MGFIKGRSFCDSCKKELSWFDNIPLFSYFWYKGKSRCCGMKISIRYPLIELFFAVCSTVLYLNLGFSLLFTTYYLLLILTISILIIDLEYQYIPDELVWLIFLICILHPTSYILLPGFIYSLLLLTIHFITKGRGMGLGDVKLVIPLGAIMGLTKLPYFIAGSFLTGGVTAFILLLLGRAKMKTKIAFGPFIIIAFWMVLLMT